MELDSASDSHRDRCTSLFQYHSRPTPRSLISMFALGIHFVFDFNERVSTDLLVKKYPHISAISGLSTVELHVLLDNFVLIFALRFSTQESASKKLQIFLDCKTMYGSLYHKSSSRHLQNEERVSTGRNNWCEALCLWTCIRHSQLAVLWWSVSGCFKSTGRRIVTFLIRLGRAFGQQARPHCISRANLSTSGALAEPRWPTAAAAVGGL